MGETHRLVSPARVFARPTADEIWLGAAQQAALSQLSRPAQIRVIVGPPSSGKTTLLQHLGTQLHSERRRAALPRSQSGRVRRARQPVAERGSRAVGSLASRAAQSADGLRAATTLAESARAVARSTTLTTSNRPRSKRSSGSWRSRSTRSPRSSYCWPARHRSPSTGKTRAAGSPHGDVLVHGLGAASQEDSDGYLDWRLGRFDMQSFMTPMALQMIARLSGGRYAAADVLCQMSLLLLRQLTLGSSGRARRAAGRRDARGAAKREARGGQAARAPSNGSTHRRRATWWSAAAARSSHASRWDSAR